MKRKKIQSLIESSRHKKKHQVSFRPPIDDLERFDAVCRGLGIYNRSEALRAAMKFFCDSILESSKGEKDA
jgi:hypothetical protein